MRKLTSVAIAMPDVSQQYLCSNIIKIFSLLNPIVAIVDENMTIWQCNTRIDSING